MNHTSIIDRWPSLSDFAADIGVSYGTAKAMRRRGSIPSEYWTKAVSAASERQIDGVSLETLAEIAASRAESLKQAEAAA